MKGLEATQQGDGNLAIQAECEKRRADPYLPDYGKRRLRGTRKREVSEMTLQISGGWRQRREVLTELFSFDRKGRALLRGEGVT